MVAARTLDKISPIGGPRRGRGKSRPFYASKSLAASAVEDGRVLVDLSIGDDPGNLDLLKDALAAAGSRTGPKSKIPKLTVEAAELLGSVFEQVAERFIRSAFAGEFEKLVSEYRVMLRENLAKGDDAQLKAALNRARLQERILAGTQMADQAEACELLGLSGANPSATMKRKEERRELLRFTVDGRAVYPLLQFDVEGRRVYPAISRIISEKPADWSDFRLLHWLSKLHLDFEETPAAALGSEPDAVLAAFEREIELQVHG